MNRFGWIFLLVLLALVAGFALLVRPGGDTAPAQAGKQEAGQPSAQRAPSGLVIPVANVRATALADTFGQARDDGARVHHALDIMAPRGTPVVASVRGVVEKIFESEAGGHTVYIRSPDRNWVFYYAHLDSYFPGLQEGQAVSQGQQIGTVGTSGNADPSGPHLHFEIKWMGAGDSWYGGRAINPYPLLAGSAAAR